MKRAFGESNKPNNSEILSKKNDLDECDFNLNGGDNGLDQDNNINNDEDEDDDFKNEKDYETMYLDQLGSNVQGDYFEGEEPEDDDENQEDQIVLEED